jgi:hypothetical protein
VRAEGINGAGREASLKAAAKARSTHVLKAAVPATANRRTDRVSAREAQDRVVAECVAPRPGETRVCPPVKTEPRVSVVIPALNEAKNLGHVLSALPEGVFEVLLVDGKSVDGTPEVARRLRTDLRVITQTRRGKGNALACGFAACSGDVIVMLDADGSADPGEIPRFVDALVAGADFAKGSRFIEGGGSADITWMRRIGNRFLMLVVNALSRTKYSDLCYGYNAFWASACLPVLNLDWQSPESTGSDGRLWGDGFEIETLINIRIAAAGLTVVEVPSYEHQRLHGVSNLNAVRDGLRVFRTIVSERRLAHTTRNPLAGADHARETAPYRPAAGAPAFATHAVERRTRDRRRNPRLVAPERRSGFDRRREPSAASVGSLLPA